MMHLGNNYVLIKCLNDQFSRIYKFNVKQGTFKLINTTSNMFNIHKIFKIDYKTLLITRNMTK